MKSSNFQTIVLIIFGLGIVAGVIAFATYRAISAADKIPSLTVWGTLPEDYFNFLGALGAEDDYLTKMTYRRIPPEEFDKVFVDALADGVGPDVVLIRDDHFYKHRNRLYQVPYENYSASDYYETFVKSSKVFEGERGFYAFPAVIDPLVMYWNKDIFASVGLASPPKYWDEMIELSERVTITDGFLNINRSAVPLGTYSNIENAKNIISLFMMQTGSSIVSNSKGVYSVDISSPMAEANSDLIRAFKFYTDFSNPNNSSYSWNSSMPNSLEAFLAEEVAIYFGLASEEDFLAESNPNLSYGVKLMPQFRNSAQEMTTGRMYGFAVTNQSISKPKNRGRKVNHAYEALFALIEPKQIQEIDQRTGLPSSQVKMLRENTHRASSAAVVDSAIKMRLWVDPHQDLSSSAFLRTIESIRSNHRDAGAAVSRLRGDISNLLKSN